MEVRRAFVPVVATPRGGAPGGCDSLDPRQIELQVDGEPVAVAGVDRAPFSRVHALLLDTSGSMGERGRLEAAKQGALEYIAQLPPGESVLLASFDDDLVLRVPPTTDLARLRPAIHALEPGANTALWDAADALLRYLASFPEYKVLVLFTDGGDVVSLPWNTARSVAQLASAIPWLTLFPVGLELSSRGSGPGPPPRMALTELARRTGGTLIEARHPSGLRAAFAAARARLDALRFLAYEPAKEPRTATRVRVRVLPSFPCRLRAAGPVWSATSRMASLVETLGDDAEEDSHNSRLEAPHVPSGRLRFAAWPAQTSGPFLEMTPPTQTGQIAGRIVDVLVQPSVLYDHRVWNRSGKLRLEMDREAVVSERPFVFYAPDPDFVAERHRSPETAVDSLLERAASARGLAAGEGMDEAWIQGLTFFRAREALARALLEWSPAYRAWAQARIRELERPGQQALLEQLRREGVPEARQRALQSALERRHEIEPPLAARVLAEWLGDIEAAELARRLELRFCRKLLAAGSPAAQPDLAARWDTLRRWLAPPTRVRVQVPLVMAYDPEREVFGFYRVVSMPQLRGPARPPTPARPLGWMLLRALLQNARVAQALRGLRIESIEYLPVPSPTSPARVRLRLTGDRPSAAALQLEGELEHEGWYAPLRCLEVSAPGGDPSSGDLARALKALESGAAIGPCAAR